MTKVVNRLALMDCGSLRPPFEGIARGALAVLLNNCPIGAKMVGYNEQTCKWNYWLWSGGNEFRALNLNLW